MTAFVDSESEIGLALDLSLGSERNGMAEREDLGLGGFVAESGMGRCTVAACTGTVDLAIRDGESEIGRSSSFGVGGNGIVGGLVGGGVMFLLRRERVLGLVGGEGARIVLVSLEAEDSVIVIGDVGFGWLGWDEDHGAIVCLQCGVSCRAGAGSDRH